LLARAGGAVVTTGGRLMLGSCPAALLPSRSRLERARLLDPSFRLTLKLGHHSAAKSRQFAKFDAVGEISPARNLSNGPGWL
jgi:hypothetical protein